MINQNNTEVLIVTTAIRNISEQRNGMLVTPLGIDEDDYILKTINNIKINTNISNFTVVIDHKINSSLSLSYLNRLKKIKNINLVVSPSSVTMPSQLTASMAFKLGIKNISKDYLLFWEHDHLFNECINWEIIKKCFEGNGRMVNFNRKINNKKSYPFFVDEKSKLFPESSNLDKNLLYFPMYSNGPFIAEKTFCEELWSETSFEIPSWNGNFGGFVEGPVEQRIVQDLFNLNLSEFKEKYPIYLYGGFLSDPIVFHFGEHKGIYKNKFYKVLDRFRIFVPLRKLKLLISNNIHKILWKTYG